MNNNVSEYIKNPVWNLVTGNLQVLTTNRLGENYILDEVNCTAVIKRRPLYYLINNVYPSLILNLITLLAFFLPFSSQASISIKKNHLYFKLKHLFTFLFYSINNFFKYGYNISESVK